MIQLIGSGLITLAMLIIVIVMLPSSKKEHDKIKRDFCQKNSFSLLEIPYWNFSKYKEIIMKELT